MAEHSGASSEASLAEERDDERLPSSARPPALQQPMPYVNEGLEAVVTSDDDDDDDDSQDSGSEHSAPGNSDASFSSGSPSTLPTSRHPSQPQATLKLLDVGGFDNAEIEKLSEAIDKFRELKLEKHVALPQLVVAGNQSSGKSSLLESLTGVPFPKGVGVCTRYATEITLRSATRESVEFSITSTSSTPPERRARIENFGKPVYDKLDTESFRSLLVRVAQVFWGTPNGSNGANGAADFAEEMLRIEISGPRLKPLKFIDTPGLYSSESRKQTKAGAELVRKLVEDLIVPNRTIIVAVMDSRVNAETQNIFQLASNSDPGRMRTIGVLTKCDLLADGGEQELAVKLAQNQVIKLHHGWFTVKNRSEKDVVKQLPLSQARQNEGALFSAPEWSTVSNMERAGITSLKTFLGERFCHHLRDEFPKICQEIKSQLREAQKERAALGPARGSAQEQRDFLIAVAERYQREIDRTLKEDFASAVPWDHESKIWIRMRNLSTKFKNDMSRGGHLHAFASLVGSLDERTYVNAGRPFQETHDYDDKDDQSEGGPDGLPGEGSIQDFMGSSDRGRDSSSEDALLTTSDDGESPRNIYVWINMQYHASVGRGLPGVVNFSLLESLFREQTKPWHQIALHYLKCAESILLDVVEFSFRQACANQGVQGRAVELLKFEARKCFKQARSRLRNFLQVERCYMQTTDPSFLEAVSEARVLRFQQTLGVIGEQKSGSISIKVENLNHLKDVLNETRPIVFEIHDLLCAYYKVSLQRFVDSAVVHVVHGFLLGENGPLKVFSRDYVRSLPTFQLKDIAGEELATISERKRLNDKIERLEGALNLSANILGPAFVSNLDFQVPSAARGDTGQPHNVDVQSSPKASAERVQDARDPPVQQRSLTPVSTPTPSSNVPKEEPSTLRQKAGSPKYSSQQSSADLFQQPTPESTPKRRTGRASRSPAAKPVAEEVEFGATSSGVQSKSINPSADAEPLQNPFAAVPNYSFENGNTVSAFGGSSAPLDGALRSPSQQMELKTDPSAGQLHSETIANPGQSFPTATKSSFGSRGGSGINPNLQPSFGYRLQ